MASIFCCPSKAGPSPTAKQVATASTNKPLKKENDNHTNNKIHSKNQFGGAGVVSKRKLVSPLNNSNYSKRRSTFLINSHAPPSTPPEGSSTQYLRFLVPNTIKGVVFGTRNLKCCVLGPSRSCLVLICHCLRHSEGPGQHGFWSKLLKGSLVALERGPRRVLM